MNRIPVAIFLSLLLAACDNNTGVPQDGVQELNFENGGTVEIADAASPIAGAKVVIAARTLAADREIIRIEYEDELPGEFNDQAKDLGAVQASRVLVLSRTGVEDLALPAEVTLPYDKSKVPDSAIPVALYWDPTLNAYSAVAVSVIDREVGTITFRTAHFSKFVVAVLSGLFDIDYLKDLPDVDTKFRPDVDGFFQTNFGAYDHAGGSCLGMANYSAWYFTAKKNQAKQGKGLYSLYREGRDATDVDDQIARELISRSFLASNDWWVDLSTTRQAYFSPAWIGYQLWESMVLTGSPQTLVFLQEGSLARHAVTVYRYDSVNERFEIYDNNYPGEFPYLPWSAATGFGEYSKSSLTNQKIAGYVYESMHSSFSPQTFEDLFWGAEDGWSSSRYATIALTAPSQTDQGKPNDYEVPSATNVRIAGNVSGPGTEADEDRWAWFFLNGGSDLVGTTKLTSDNMFAANIRELPNPTNSDVMVVVSQSNKRWRTGFIAFKQFSVRQAGARFFDNFGFESGDVAPWGSERHLWTGGSVIVPSDKSVIVSEGVDPIATDIPTVRFGRFSVRINNYDGNYHISSLRQAAVVPVATNPVVRFSWAAVLEDPDHDPADQPYVDVAVFNTTKNIDLYHQRFYANDPGFSGWQPYQGGNWKAIPWQLVEVDAKDYVGDTIELRVEAADCALGAHGGYAYLDAEE